MTRNSDNHPSMRDQNLSQHHHDKLADSLINARRGQRQKIGLVLVCLLGVAVLGGGFFLQSRAITLAINPEKAATTAQLKLLSPYGFVIGNRAYLLARFGELRIDAPDFIPATIPLLPPDWGKTMTVTLEPKPAELSLTFTPPSPQSRYILENEAGDIQELSGATLSLSLAPGKYRLDVDNPLAARRHPLPRPLGKKLKRPRALSRGAVA